MTVQVHEDHMRRHTRQRVYRSTAFTPEDANSAARKIALAASLYSSSHTCSMKQAFMSEYRKGGAMDRTEFRAQMKKTFSVSLTAGELSALFERFDRDGDGTVDGMEFMNAFFRISRWDFF